MSKQKRYIVVLYTIAIIALMMVDNPRSSHHDTGISHVDALNYTIPAPSGLESHNPIIIDGNDQLDAFCAGNGTSGNETYPHVISGYDIFVGTSVGGIYLKNTDRHVIIENNRAWNSTNMALLPVPAGIVCINATNAIIKNNTLESNLIGVGIYDSFSITILNNTFSNNMFLGLAVNYSRYSVVKNNTFFGSGIGLNGSLDECLDHDIDLSNTMNENGKIYYIKHAVGNITTMIMPKSQIILVNCSNTVIQDISFSSTGIALMILYSRDIVVSRVNCNNNSLYGICCINSNGSTIIDTEVDGAIYGLALNACINTTVRSNYIHDNLFDGIVVYASNFTTVEQNVAARNGKFDIKVLYSFNVTIQKNTATWSLHGIGITEHAGNITITRNIVSNNFYGVFMEYSYRFNVTQNQIENNEVGIQVYDVNNSIVYLNNVINSTTYQAYEEVTSNAFNTSTWGNFWSDYSVKYPLATNVTMYTWNTSYEIDGSTITEDMHPLISPDQFPLATFAANATRAVVGQSVSFDFTGIAGEAPVTMLWNFGDNGSSTMQDPMHVYSNPGTYSVSLGISDMHHECDMLQVNRYMIVEADMFPIANFTCNQTRAMFDSFIEFRFTGTEGNGPARFTWKILGDSIDTNETTITYRFEQAGTISVQLIVTDYDGDTSTYTFQVVIDAPIGNLVILAILLIASTIGAIATIVLVQKRRQIIKKG